MNESRSTTTRTVTQTESGLSVWKEASVVKTYLESLAKRAPRQIRDAESQLVKVQEQLDAETHPAKRLQLVQRRIELTEFLEAKDEAQSSEAEWEFLLVAKSYSDRKGISYKAWREIGVPAEVLKEAGIER